MQLGEFLYQLSQRDLQGALITNVSLFNAATLNNAQVPVQLYTVPDDQAMIINALGFLLQPTAGNFVTGCWSTVQPKNSAIETIVYGESFNTALSFPFAFGDSVEILVSPGTVIRSYGRFSAAGVGNTLNAYLHGWLIPRGNLGSV